MKTAAFLLAAAGVTAYGIRCARTSGKASADLTGKVALVTGGSRGLGFLLARELGRQGCRVAICARDEQELQRARQALAEDAPQVLAVKCDVSQRDDVTRMVHQVAGGLGPVDILVNNAGIIQVGPARTMTLEDYELALDVMYWGVLYPKLAALPSMLDRGDGTIVNITSIGGKVSVPHLLPYSAAKFAATGFSEGLRSELAGTGVRVTTIAPGLMRTGSYLNAFFKGRKQKELTWFSLGAALPLISMDAERAAAQIVRAARRGEAERTLSVPATLLDRFHGLFPGLTAELLGLTARFVLPGADGQDPSTARGMEVAAEHPSPLRERLTTLGGRAAGRFNEYPGPDAGVGVAVVDS
jgi:NAD(P)-dependent dehydrogenase (short-subunit alcohol dehydrogenase family)